MRKLLLKDIDWIMEVSSKEITGKTKAGHQLLPLMLVMKLPAGKCFQIAVGL